MPYSVQLAGPEDKLRILEMIGELLPEVDPERRYQWLYKDNPHGPALTWMAIDQETGLTAGITSFFRRRLWTNPEEIGGALGGDGYVRPRFRRRGIGQAMHAASRADMERLGVSVMFGTPMPANMTPLGHAGARDVTDTVRYVRPLVGRLLKLAGARPGKAPTFGSGSSRLRLVPATPLDPRIDALWTETRPELGIATVRDAAFYTWRFLRSPSQRQQALIVLHRDSPIAACGLERVGDRLRIIDLVAPLRHWGQALRAIIDHAQGCEVVETKLTREDGQARRMWTHGFVGRETKPLNLLLPEGSPHEALLHGARRWFFTWAEADLDFS